MDVFAKIYIFLAPIFSLPFFVWIGSFFFLSIRFFLCRYIVSLIIDLNSKEIMK